MSHPSPQAAATIAQPIQAADDEPSEAGDGVGDFIATLSERGSFTYCAMSAGRHERRTGKVIDCSIGEAKARRDQARAYRDVAEMVLADSASRYEAQVAAARAVWLRSRRQTQSAASSCIATAEDRTMPRQ